MLLCLVFFLNAHAQQIAITGKVTVGEANETLPGVNVLEKGTQNGTITGVDGNYSLNVKPNAILVFSFIGMKIQEIAINGKTRLDVLIDDETIGLEEVVAIGYGTAKKGDLTGKV
jgi:hypothetical protein